GSGLALGPRTPFANAQKWFFQQLVEHVLRRLMVPDPADPGRQVIDNTIIYTFSEIGEGAWHTSKSSPIQLSGNPNGVGTDRPAGDIYLALCRAMGVQQAAFGNATNPLTEILA